MLLKFHASWIGFAFVLAGMHVAVAIAETPARDPQASHQWRGFQNVGHPAVAADELPTVWTPTSGIAWRASIEGYGQSTPISGHEQIVVTSTSGPEKDSYHLTSVAIHTGEKEWQLDFDNPSPFANTPMVSRAAPTAVATAFGFIASFEGGLVVAVDAKGNEVWRKNLVDQYGKIEARHGLAGSLEQDDENVFVWVERTDDPYLLAIDKQTGEVAWKAPGIGVTSWASPRLITVGDDHHLVCSGSGKIIGYDPKTGDRLWEFDKIANNSSCTPMPVGDGTFLIGASDGRGESASGDAAASNGLMQIKRSEDGRFSLEYVWQAEKATCTFGSPVVAGDRALFVNRTGVLYQLDLKTGQQLSALRTNAGGIWATPIVAGEVAYLFGHQGDTSVVSPRNDQELAVNRAWAAATDSTPQDNTSTAQVLYAAAAIGDYLVIRSGSHLYAIARPSKSPQ